MAARHGSPSWARRSAAVDLPPPSRPRTNEIGATDPVDVAPWIWQVTIGATVVFFVFDVWHMRRNPHEPSMKECLIALSFYVGAAVLFGLGVWYFAGAQYGGE